MKIHLHQQGIYMAGKAWEIQRKLKEYSQTYETVAEWIGDERKHQRENNVIPFSIKNSSNS